MSDELVKRLRDEHLAMTRNEAADRIEALTAQLEDWKAKAARQAEQITGLEKSRRRLESLTAGAHRRVKDVEAERDALTADNARLQEALTGIKRAAAHRMKNDPKDLHSYYFHTADAALNTGKEVMPNDARTSRPAHDIGPGDQAVAGAAPVTVRDTNDDRVIRDLTMIVIKLVRYAPEAETNKIFDYLHRKRLASPLRAQPEPVAGAALDPDRLREDRDERQQLDRECGE